MGSSSILLVMGLVFASTFSLLYLAPIGKALNKQALIQSLQVADANAYIARTTIHPQNICFTLNQEVLAKYSGLTSAVANADDIAERESSRAANNTTITNQRSGHIYSSFAIDTLHKSDMLSLISDYDFNETIPHHSYVQDPFIKQDTQFSCGFRYLDNNYLLTLTFTTIENVTGTHGYSAVRITPTMIDNSGATFSDNRSSEKSTAIITYVPFNNTVVFFNELPNPVTIEVRSNSNNFQAAVSNETLYIPANKITDITLYPNWNTLADDLYHYQVKEYPSINGDIAVVKKYNTECMDNQTTKSIYSQRNFEVSFPSYLPDGFKHICNSQNTDTYMIQVYANQTAAENYKRLGLLHQQSNSNPYAYYLYPTMSQEELSGILLVHAQKSFGNDPQAELYNSYKQALNDTSRYYSTNPRFFSTNGNSYFSYYEGNILPVVDVAKADSTYRVEGLLPMSELEKVAESLSSQ